MNPIQVIAYVAYPGSKIPEELRSRAAQSVVLAVKGASTLFRTSEIPSMEGGPGWTLDQESRDKVFPWFGALGVKELIGLDSAAIVPVPGSSSTTPDQVRQGCTFRLAAALGDLSGLAVIPFLFWDRPLKPTKDGGPRGAEELLPRLRLGEMPEGVTHAVLVDDVYTTGGHVRACEAALRMHAGVQVDRAICVAMTVEDPDEAAFGRKEISLERYLDSL